MDGPGPGPLTHFFKALFIDGDDAHRGFRLAGAADTEPEIDRLAFKLLEEAGIEQAEQGQDDDNPSHHIKGGSFAVMDLDFFRRRRVWHGRYSKGEEYHYKDFFYRPITYKRQLTMMNADKRRFNFRLKQD